MSQQLETKSESVESCCVNKYSHKLKECSECSGNNTACQFYYPANCLRQIPGYQPYPKHPGWCLSCIVDSKNFQCPGRIDPTPPDYRGTHCG